MIDLRDISYRTTAVAYILYSFPENMEELELGISKHKVIKILTIEIEESDLLVAEEIASGDLVDLEDRLPDEIKSLKKSDESLEDWFTYLLSTIEDLVEETFNGK